MKVICVQANSQNHTALTQEYVKKLLIKFLFNIMANNFQNSIRRITSQGQQLT